MSISTQIVLALIALHLLFGFGWLMYKLSPRKKNEDENTEQ